MSDKVRVAILGCGAITRSAHLPTVLLNPEADLIALVDADNRRAESLAHSFGVKCQIAADYRAVLSQVDAIINALPNQLHAAVTQESLAAGVHVLCEKPLATTAADGRACCEAAQRHDRLLAVGMNHRFDAANDLLRLVLEQELLGRLEGYDWEWGGSFDWRSASGFYFSKAAAGGGALIDFGVHLLDNLIDWFGPVESYDYQDDDWGSGIEANAILTLRHNGPLGNIAGRVRISRTYSLKNRFHLQGAEAAAEITVADPDAVIMQRNLGGSAVTDTLRLNDRAGKSNYARQLENFLASIKLREKLRVDGWQALRVMELVEACYARKRQIPEPWTGIPAATSGVLA